MRPSIRRVPAWPLPQAGSRSASLSPGLAQGVPRSYESVARGLPGARLARPDARADDHLGARAVGQDAFARPHGGLLPDRLPAPLPLPDGRVVDAQRQAGTAFVQDPIEAHAVQNTGERRVPDTVMAESE